MFKIPIRNGRDFSLRLRRLATDSQISQISQILICVSTCKSEKSAKSAHLWQKTPWAERKQRIATIKPRYLSFYIKQQLQKTHMAKTFTLTNSDLIVQADELMNYAQDEYQFEPSQGVVDSILRYSQSLEIRKSKFVGTVETVSN